MKILFIASEAYPLVKTGGLADVAGALPAELQKLGVDVRLLIPGYPQAMETAGHRGAPIFLGNWHGMFDLRIIPAAMPGSGVPVFLLDCPALFMRDGGPYQDPDGQDWPDNHLRFGALCRAAVWMAGRERGLVWTPDILHAHDWQAGLVPALAAQMGSARPKTVFTAHNMSFVGGFPVETAPLLDIPPSMTGVEGVEFYGQLSFLKAGLFYADRITTVSPTYAQEIKTFAGGDGFDGLMRARESVLSGILNGIDCEVWNPATDSHLVSRYSADDISGRAPNKAELQREMGLPQDPSAPLLGMVSRLTEQKGADIVFSALPRILEEGAQLVILGSGQREIVALALAAAGKYPKQVSVRIGFHEDIAHRMQAGCDMILVPSRFEPCGLTQFYAMRYGALPVVRRVGGLADSVVDADEGDGAGFTFDLPDGDDLAGAVVRAIAAFRNPQRWRQLQLRAMAGDFSWKRSAGKYRDLYCSLPLSTTA